MGSVIGRPLLRALLYHRVAPRAPEPDLLNPDLITTSPARFERQLAHVARFYHPIGADELLAALDGRHVLPPRAVLVTFDDGYRDFLEIAWPLLKRFQIPAAVFVATAFADCPNRVFWWDAVWQIVIRTDRRAIHLAGVASAALKSRRDRVAACDRLVNWLKTLTPAARAATVERLGEQLGVRPEPTRAALSWAELRLLAADGVTVAPHSRTHELLDQLCAPDLVHEVQGSRDDLVRELGACPPVFSYPNGNFNAGTLRALDAAGFQAGFTAARGINRLGVDEPRLLRRDPGGPSVLRLALYLLGPLAAVRAVRHPLPRPAREQRRRAADPPTRPISGVPPRPSDTTTSGGR